MLAIIAVGVVLWQTMRKTVRREVVPVTVAVEAVAILTARCRQPRIFRRPDDYRCAPLEQAPALPSRRTVTLRREHCLPPAWPELTGLSSSKPVAQGAALVVSSAGAWCCGCCPSTPPKQAFSALEEDGKMLMDPAGYTRYDGYAEAICHPNTGALVNNFHTMRPLYEEAYGRLGLNRRTLTMPLYGCWIASSPHRKSRAHGAHPQIRDVPVCRSAAGTAGADTEAAAAAGASRYPPDQESRPESCGRVC